MCIDFSGSGRSDHGGRFAQGEGQNAPFEAFCILLFFNVIFWGILSDIILLYLGHSVQDLAIISCLKCCYSRCNLAKTVKGGVLPYSTLRPKNSRSGRKYVLFLDSNGNTDCYS